MKNILMEDLEIISKATGMKLMGEKTILITGATGLIGSLFVKAISVYNQNNSEKIRVIGQARNLQKLQKVFGDLSKDKNIIWLISDLIDLTEIEYDIDYIIHTASVTASKLFVTRPVETIETTYQGTKNILEIARQKRCKSMVYLSSMEMYGVPDSTLESVREEDLGYIDLMNVRSSYSEGKRIAECLCASYCEEYGVPVKIARLAQTFGAGVSEEDNRVYAQFARSAIMKKDIVLHTKGESYGNYCYTSDAIKALLLLLLKGENGQAYNVSNEENTTMIVDMAKMVAEQFGEGKIKVCFDIPKDKKMHGYAPDVKMKLSSEKIRKLGWKAKYSLPQMYERMIEGIMWERENG